MLRLSIPAAPAQAAPARVDVGDFFYRAYRVKVNPGEAVTWRLSAHADADPVDRGDGFCHGGEPHRRECRGSLRAAGVSSGFSKTPCSSSITNVMLRSFAACVTR